MLLTGTLIICICENKDADQLRGKFREADQRLCFRYSDSTIPLLQASSSFLPVCVGPVRKPHYWFSHEAAQMSRCLNTGFTKWAILQLKWYLRAQVFFFFFFFFFFLLLLFMMYRTVFLSQLLFVIYQTVIFCMLVRSDCTHTITLVLKMYEGLCLYMYIFSLNKLLLVMCRKDIYSIK